MGRSPVLKLALASWAMGTKVALACQPSNRVEGFLLEAPLPRCLLQRTGRGLIQPRNEPIHRAGSRPRPGWSGSAGSYQRRGVGGQRREHGRRQELPFSGPRRNAGAAPPTPARVGRPNRIQPHPVDDLRRGWPIGGAEIRAERKTPGPNSQTVLSPTAISDPLNVDMNAVPRTPGWWLRATSVPSHEAVPGRAVPGRTWPGPGRARR